MRIRHPVHYLDPAPTAEMATVQVPVPILGHFADVRDRFFALCLDASRQVLTAMMEEDRSDAKRKANPSRQAKRGGLAPSEITLGGRRRGYRRAHRMFHSPHHGRRCRNPDAVAKMALDMVAASQEVRIQSGESIRVRIGINRPKRASSRQVGASVSMSLLGRKRATENVIDRRPRLPSPTCVSNVARRSNCTVGGHRDHARVHDQIRSRPSPGIQHAAGHRLERWTRL